MFNWFNKKQDQPELPEVLGLRLGGVFELDLLKIKLIQDNLTIDMPSKTQMIQAVGEVKLDEQTRLLRFYTDDDGYLQVLQQGNTDDGVTEVKLVYFYNTTPIDTEESWKNTIYNELIQPERKVGSHSFYKAWENEKAVAMTEKTWIAEDKHASSTDQFVMVYEREANSDIYESLFVIAEEKIINNQYERCLVVSTAIDLIPTDFTVVA